VTLIRLCLAFGYRKAATTLLLLFLASNLAAQSLPPIIRFGASVAFEDQQPGMAAPEGSAKPNPDVTKPQTAPDSAESVSNSGGEQTKRILGIAPNFQAVSANTHLPPLSPKQKLWLATQGTFDYSSFIAVGFQAAVELASKTYPEFHQGAAGYGRYYWHTFADGGIENYLTGAIVPIMTHEDPRYYTLFHGGFFRRTGYAFSRLWITRKDAGGETLNVSEIVGSGVATVVSSRYYPENERKGGEVLERWGSQMLNDAVGNVFTEFWPDIHHKFFERHPKPQPTQ
jgi:hypothetical protein